MFHISVSLTRHPTAMKNAGAHPFYDREDFASLDP